MAKVRILKKLGLRDVMAFKLSNRRGFAVIAKNNLTEGRSLAQAYSRLIKACRRRGYELPEGKLPAISK